MAVSISSYNEILGKLVRKMIADTPVNDINRGSVLLTLLEAVAAQDFENSANILSVLESLSIDALKNSDLDQRAADYGLTRTPASKSTGFITIKDTSISKRSTSLYALKQPPITGTTVLYVNDASAWDASGGSLYIGRGTQQFEGPIDYSSIVNNGSFYTINLSSALQYDHLISDYVVDKQNTVDRLISSGTVVKIPANNQNPEILYSTLRDAVLPAGEDSISGIAIIANQVGSSSNTGINTIVQFSSLPFSTASVTNSNALIDGRDTESDDDLRERVKSYTSTLARGTRESILSAIIGVSDSLDGKQVSSATITEPAAIGEPSVVYIDDGSGFQPTFKGQNLDVVLSSATGGEEFLQLANFPLPRPQVVNLADGPYSLVDESTMSVLIDNSEEQITFKSSQFNNIASATLQEIANAINDQSINFKCRLTDDSSRLLLYPTSYDVEFIQVAPLSSGSSSVLYANSYLKFPTNRYSYIALYKNNTLLSEKEFPATLRTIPKSNWAIVGSGDLTIEVDGTPAQNRSFTSLDFDGQAFSVLTVADWVSAFNKKFAGITATATSADQLEISSNKIGLGSSLSIVGGTYSSHMFAGVDVYSEGKTSDFALNRQNGNLQLKIEIQQGDTVTAGSADAKGSIVSETSSGVYSLTSDSFERPAEAVIIADGNSTTFRSEVSPIIGTTISVSVPSTGKMKITSNVSTLFTQAQVGDFVYIAYRGTGSNWLSSENCGLFKICEKGKHTNPGVDSWIKVNNADAVATISSCAVQASEDIQVFSADSYPQIWRGSSLSSPGSATFKSINDSIKSNIENVKSSTYKTSSIKLTSSTENDGSIAVPVSIGLMTNLFPSEGGAQLGNQSNVATKATQKDLISYFKRTSHTTTWLDRSLYSDIRGSLSSNSTPPISGSGESLSLNSPTLSSSNIDYDNVINVTSGSNKSQFRNIKEFSSSSVLSTQSEIPNTLFDYLSNDEISILESLTMSADDSIVFILDGDAVNKTVNVNFWRTGRINSSFAATNTQFSAYDSDNESGVDFGNQAIWSKINTNTEFKDYAVWFRSRNWYKTDSDDAGMIIRAKEYGPAGDKYSFKMEYPSLPNQSASIKHSNTSSETVSTYTFASDDQIATGITSGTNFSVKQISGNNYRLKFKETYVDFSSLNPENGDIIAITDPNISSGNRGVFRINAFDAVNRTIDIANASAVASVEGSPQSYEITTTQDIVGTPGSITITCTAQGSTTSTVGSGDYFVLRDGYGNKIVFWYAIDNVGSQPTLSGIYQYIKIGTVATGATAANIASATASIVNSAYPDFTASYTSGNSFNVINNFNGPVTLDTGGQSSTGFAYSKVDGVADNTLGGRYFTIYDTNGSVAVWMNVNGEAEPIHGEDRSIQVVIPAGSSASDVADLISLSIDADSQFESTAVGSTITVDNVQNGLLSLGEVHSSGFTFSSSTSLNGVDDEYEVVSSAPGVKVFPLTENDCETIATYITQNSSVINAVPITGLSSGKFTKTTKEETSSVGYGHSVGNLKINLFDGESFVKTFSNASPHFTLKKPLTLQNQSLNYDMRTCPNPDTSDTGEFFKLLPKTVKNVKHHLSHKALSQLPIVADVDISNKFRRVQIKSKKLGTSGSVEVVGGRANLGEFSIFGDGQISDGTVEIRTSAYPSTINAGDTVRIYNEKPAKRLSRLKTTDTIDVVAYSSGDAEYILNKKQINSSYFTSWKVTDVSVSEYGVEQGVVWRWEHNEAGGSIQIVSNINGNVSTTPNEYPISGTTPGTVSLEIFNTSLGATSSPLTFNISVNSVPTQGDYFTFQNTLGYSFAVWFSINGNTTQSTATTYTSAATKIQVDVLNTDTPNTIVNKIKTALDNAGTVFSSRFTASQKSATSLEDVSPGDVLGVWGNSNFITNFNIRNQSQLLGDDQISNFPIIAVDVDQRHMDVVNPNGVAVSSFTMPTTNGNIEVFPSVGIRWRTKDTAYVYINSITVSSGVAEVLTDTPHGFGLGETIQISDSGNLDLNSSIAVSDTSTISSFKFSTSAADGTYTGAVALKSGKTRTRYKIESLGFNNLIRISRTDGDSPYFTDCGIAVDDFVKISGSTFSSVNNGFFRILAVDNDSFVIENSNFKEELNTFKKINNLDTAVIWQANSTQVTGVAGSFSNVSLGDWIKKKEDSEDYLVQVIGFNTGNATTATSITIGSRYRGSDSTSEGVAFDQEIGVGTGSYLDSKDDFIFYSADSIIAGDSLIIDNFSDPTWFKTSNSGVFTVKEYGTKSDSKSQFIRVYNIGAISQSDVDMSTNEDGLYLLENENYKYESIRSVEHAAINEFNANQRTLYIKPIHQVYKISDIYGSKIQSLGKLGFDVGITSGVDGYVYYTGLMQTVQRIIDGYEPDAASYPGRRAVGSLIEVLPPLIKPIEITIDVTTRDGINLTDISNDIKSTIINYVNSLGVGQDVILSEITARAMAINGVNAVTFTNPAPTNERIAIDDDQKAFISPDLISLS